MTGPQKEKVKVVLFPWLAHGHISPFLDLAITLSQSQSTNFHCYLVSTPANLVSIKPKIPAKHSLSIQLVDLHLPASPDLPPHRHTTNGLPPHLHAPLRRALDSAKPDFSNLLATLKPDLVIHDILQPWAGLIASSSQHNLPSVTFFTASAAPLSYFYHLGTHPGQDFPFPAIQLDSFALSMALGYLEESSKNEQDQIKEEEYTNTTNINTPMIMLVNTSREMEGKYMDYLSEMMRKTIVPVGALVRDLRSIDDDDDGNFEGIMEWLGTKDENSTVFVSFGTEYFLSDDEVEEIAIGLETSGANFIWVLRFPEGDQSHPLPEGFVERVGERGRVVVNGWAPQARILGHASVGGFVSHCGWSSLRESIECGVPIVGVPMHLDQPVNAKLVVEMGVGVEVRGRVGREEVSRAVREVVVGKGGEELRRRVGEQRERIRVRSREEAEEVARVLAGICGVN